MGTSRSHRPEVPQPHRGLAAPTPRPQSELQPLAFHWPLVREAQGRERQSRQDHMQDPGPQEGGRGGPSASQVTFSSVLEPRTAPLRGAGPPQARHLPAKDLEGPTFPWLVRTHLPSSSQTLLSTDGVLLPAVNSPRGCRTLKFTPQGRHPHTHFTGGR